MDNQHEDGQPQNALPGSADIGEAGVNYITKLSVATTAQRSISTNRFADDALHASPCVLNFGERVFEDIFNRLANLWTGNGSDGDPAAPPRAAHAAAATVNRKKRDPLGERGENMAARFLRNAGLKIIARNYKCALGEIDIVARDGKTLVFVEVKTRAFDDPTPEEQINEFKQHQLTKAARYYLGRFGTPQPPARFDVVAIVWAKGHEPMIRHTPGAFEATF